MGNYDSKLSKIMIAFLLILIGIIICFPIAYNNAPKTNAEINKQYDEEFITEDKNNEDELSEDDEQDDIDIEYKKSRKHYKENIDDIDDTAIEPIEEINDNREPVQVESEQNTNIFSSAEQYIKEKNYSQAISEYETIAKNTDDSKVKALCYEKIAYSYAITKRYGTALAFVQRAYNISPSTPRELLLARLYYKTGHQDKANDYIKEILKRDFDKD